MSNKQSKHQQLSNLLQQLEVQLKQNKLWQTLRPTASALSSSQPFCIDTLSFEQWLQFVFIEKIDILIKSNAALPTQICLSPMAEEAFRKLQSAPVELLKVIAAIDKLMSD